MENRDVATPEIIDNLRRVFQAICEFSKEAEHATGLTGPQLWVLKILGNTSPLRLSDLARQMYLRPATVVGIIDRLEAKGLVARSRSSKDRRVVDLSLTDQGRTLVSNAPEVAQSLLVKGLSGLSVEQFACVDEGMKQMVRLLGAEHVVPQPLNC